MALSFRKHWPEAPADFFAVEAAGLRWLAAAAAAAVVDVLETDRTSITVTRLDPVPPSSAAAVEFGTALARTHGAGAAAFGEPPAGWTGDGYIGRQRLTLRPEPRWGPFYAGQRMLPYARAARELGHLTPQQLTPIERLAERIAAGDFDDDRPPARIHGDLWSGNLLSTDRGLVLIDPAAHGGHGLTDLAMLTLVRRSAPGDDPGGVRRGGRTAVRLASPDRAASAPPAAGARRLPRPLVRLRGRRDRPPLPLNPTPEPHSDPADPSRMHALLRRVGALVTGRRAGGGGPGSGRPRRLARPLARLGPLGWLGPRLARPSRMAWPFGGLRRRPGQGLPDGRSANWTSAGCGARLDRSRTARTAPTTVTPAAARYSGRGPAPASTIMPPDQPASAAAT